MIQSFDFFRKVTSKRLFILLLGLFLAGCGSEEIAVTGFGSNNAAGPAATTTSPTPGITPTTAGDLVITEIMVDPSDYIDNQGEWFEVYNPSATTIYDLNGCQLHNIGSTEIKDLVMSFDIKPGTYATLARDPSPGFTPNYIYGYFLLNQTADGVGIHCGGTLIDEVDYTSTTPVAGQTLSLKNTTIDHLSNDTFTNYCIPASTYGGTDKGTPGAVNDC